MTGPAQANPVPDENGIVRQQAPMAYTHARPDLQQQAQAPAAPHQPSASDRFVGQEMASEMFTEPGPAPPDVLEYSLSGDEEFSVEPPGVQPQYPQAQPHQQPQPPASLEEFEQQLFSEVESVGNVNPQALKESHPEVYKTWLKMQRTHSNRTRNVVEREREVESSMADLSEIQRKAAAFDEIARNPQILSGVQNPQPQGATQQQATAPIPTPAPQNPQYEGDYDDGQGQLRDMVRGELQSMRQQITQELEAKMVTGLSPLYEREQTREVDRLRDKNPQQYVVLEPRIRELRAQNPGMTYEHAYQIADAPFAEDRGRQQALMAMTTKRRVAEDVTANMQPPQLAALNPVAPQWQQAAPMPHQGALPTPPGVQPGYNSGLDPNAPRMNIDQTLDAVFDRFGL